MAQPQQPVDVHQIDVNAALNPPQEQERAPVADIAAAHPLLADNVSFLFFVFGFLVIFFMSTVQVFKLTWFVEHVLIKFSVLHVYGL